MAAIGARVEHGMSRVCLRTCRQMVRAPVGRDGLRVLLQDGDQRSITHVRRFGPCSKLVK
jgi:hypothetical protein